MTVVRTSIDIDAPPRAVWDVIMDPERYGDWVTIHRRLGHVDSGGLRKGFEVEQTLCLHRANFKVFWALAELEPPTRSVWEGRGPAGSKARTVNALAPLDGGGRTHFDYLNEYTQPGGIFGRVAGRVLVGGLAEREADASLRRLKQQLET